MTGLEAYKAKLKRLLKHKAEEPNNTYHDWDEEIQRCKNNIVDEVMEDKTGWIPVAEELPDVLIETEDKNCPYFNFTLNGVVKTLQIPSSSGDVSILIKNKRKVFELSNRQCCIMMAGQCHENWEIIFPGRKIGDHDVIINYLKTSPYRTNGGIEGCYVFVEHCSDQETANKIVSTCRKMVEDQYERLMMLRVGKKYNMTDQTLTKIKLEYHDSMNYEVSIADLLNQTDID